MNCPVVTKLTSSSPAVIVDTIGNAAGDSRWKTSKKYVGGSTTRPLFDIGRGTGIRSVNTLGTSARPRARLCQSLRKSGGRRGARTSDYGSTRCPRRSERNWSDARVRPNRSGAAAMPPASPHYGASAIVRGCARVSATAARQDAKQTAARRYEAKIVAREKTLDQNG